MKMKIAACLILVCLAIPGGAQHWLKAPVVYENMPGEIRLAGDVDGDGDVDTIRFDGNPANGFYTQFVVLSNLSDGQFVTGPAKSLPTSSSGVVVFADVNGDGWGDVIVSTLTTSSVGAGVSVFPGQPGGTFAAPVHVTLGGNVLQIRSGSANGDAVRDLAVVHFHPLSNVMAVRWILGSLANAFVAGPPRLLTPNQFVEDIAALDVNADGIDDVAASHDGVVDFYTTVAGSPTGAGPTFPIASDFGTAFMTGDIDGDSDLDLVALTANSGVPTLTRFRNQGGGSWTALPGAPYPGTNGGTPFLGDWDGDGSPDVFLRGWGFSGSPYEILKNDGAGNFVSALASPTGLPSETGGAGLFDVDADGFLDFIDSMALFYGDGSFNGFATAPGISAHPLRDWEGDGDADIPWEAGHIRNNDGRGVFTSTFITRPAAPPGEFFGGGESLIEDFDGDGLNEFLVKRFRQNPLPGCVPPPNDPQFCLFIEMRRFADTGTGIQVDLGPCAAPGVNIGQSTGVLFADDVDGDGDLDILGSQGLFLNYGPQFFAPPVSPFSPWTPIARGDVDADGDLDYLAGSFGGFHTAALLRRTGPATFNVEVIYPQTTQVILSNRPALHDLDDDGDLDVAVDQGPTGASITIYANTGGTFAPSATIPVSNSSGGYTTISAADADGDGLTDLAINVGARTRIFRRTGPGFVYEPARVYRTPPGSRFLADFDGDGDTDLVGSAIVFNNRFDGPIAGLRRQYGAGVAGTAGITPVLGTTGPLRVGNVATVRVRQAIGGSAGLLGIGSAEANVPNYGGIPGVTLLVDPVTSIMTIGLTGAPGVPGVGGMDLSVLIPPALVGLHVFVQAGFGDPGAAHGISTTNGLEILVGP
jgi:hypothetical protein